MALLRALIFRLACAEELEVLFCPRMTHSATVAPAVSLAWLPAIRSVAYRAFCTGASSVMVVVLAVGIETTFSSSAEMALYGLDWTMLDIDVITRYPVEFEPAAANTVEGFPMGESWKMTVRFSGGA